MVVRPSGKRPVTVVTLGVRTGVTRIESPTRYCEETARREASLG